MDHVSQALPQNLEQIIGALIVIVSAIIAAFKRGRIVERNGHGRKE